MKTWQLLWQDRQARWHLLAALGILALEAASYFYPSFPPMAVQWALFAVALGLAKEVVRSGLRALLKFRFSSISLLITIAAGGAIWLQQPLEAAVILSLFALSESLESHGFQQSYAALERLLAKAPKQAEVEGKGSLTVDQVQPGDLVGVKPGASVPVDGIIVEGTGLLDEASITGEPLPVSRTVGEKVFAGSLNQQGFLRVRVTHAGKDSTLQRIVAMTYEAAERKLQFQSFVERFTAWYTPMIVVLAVGLVAWSFFMGLPWQPWLERALSLLVIACPCALTMATPVAVFAAVSAANQRGVVIKGGRPLEALARLRVLAVDKTRTLTEGKPRLAEVIALRTDWDRSQVLAAAAGLEELTTHPVAKAVLDAAAAEGVHSHAIEGFKEIPGRGVEGSCLVCRDSHHCLSNPAFAKEEHGMGAEVLAQVQALQAQGKTVVILSDAKGPAGLLAIEEL